MKKIFLGVAISILLGVGLVLSYGNTAQASITTSRFNPVAPGLYQNYSFFSATTTSATSTNSAVTNDPGYFQVAGAKKVVMYFGRGDATGHGNTGSSIFSVQVTPDGTNWYNYNKLAQNLATSTVQTVISSVTITAATSTTVTSLELSTFGFQGVRCVVVKVTDGEASCNGYAEF